MIITAQREIPRGTITLSGGKIAAVTEGTTHPGEDEPAEPLTFVPGFVDLHNHGGNGGAFPTGDVDSCERAARYHRAHGTTTLWASMVSANEEELTRQMRVVSPLVQGGLLDGIHLEGPFVNACRCGAQDPSRIQPGDPDMLERIIAASEGTVRSITFAPETECVAELIEVCARHRVVVSLGHTDASAEVTIRCVDKAQAAGCTVTATHLFNAMPPLHHRAPGAAGALLSRSVGLELIADGVHLHDTTVDMVTAAAPTRAFAITDAMEAAGLPDGSYVLGQLAVEVTDGVARLREGGAIAGGTSTLDQQFRRYAARHGEVAAVQLTSTNAARVLGRSEEIGDIRPGLRANLVAFNASGQVAGVWVDGERYAGDEQKRPANAPADVD